MRIAIGVLFAASMWGQRMSYQECVDATSKFDILKANLQATRESAAGASGIRGQALAAEAKQLEADVAAARPKADACARQYPAEKASGASECAKIASDIVNVQSLIRVERPNAQAGDTFSKHRMNKAVQDLADLRAAQRNAGCPEAQAPTSSGPVSSVATSVIKDCQSGYQTLNNVKSELASVRAKQAPANQNLANAERQLQNRSASVSPELRARLTADANRMRAEAEKLNQEETYLTSQISMIREGMQSKGCDPDTGKTGAPVMRSSPSSGASDKPVSGLYAYEGTWIVSRQRLAKEGGGETPWGTLTLRKVDSGEGSRMAAEVYGRRSLAEHKPCRTAAPCQYYLGEVRFAPEWIEFRQRWFQNNLSGAARQIQQTAQGRVVAAADGILTGRFDGVVGVAGSVRMEIGSNPNSTRGTVNIDGPVGVTYGGNLIFRRAR